MLQGWLKPRLPASSPPLPPGEQQPGTTAAAAVVDGHVFASPHTCSWAGGECLRGVGGGGVDCAHPLLAPLLQSWAEPSPWAPRLEQAGAPFASRTVWTGAVAGWKGRNERGEREGRGHVFGHGEKRKELCIMQHYIQYWHVLSPQQLLLWHGQKSLV